MPTGGAPTPPEERISKLDLYELGLYGGQDSAEKRRALCRRMGLPARLSAGALADVLTAMSTRGELLAAMENEETQ